MIDIVQVLKLSLPVIQAPLPCYDAQIPLAVQVSNLGGLGTVDVCSLGVNAEALSDLISDVKLRTSNAFAVVYDMQYVQSDSLNIDTFLHAVTNDPVPVVFFRHGFPDNDVIRQLKRVGTLVCVFASSVLEAMAIEVSHVDVIALQGLESGGILSQFDNDLDSSPLPMNTLLQQTRPLVSKPIVVWGDITSSASLVSALVQGAQAVIIDTPLWTCADTPLPENVLAQVRQATEVNTVLNTKLLGKPCRYIPNAPSKSIWGEHYVERLQACRDAILAGEIIVFSGLSAQTSAQFLPALFEGWNGEVNRIFGLHADDGHDTSNNALSAHA